MNRVKIIITTECDKVVLKASLCKDADDKMQFLQSFKCPDCLSSLLLKLSVAASNTPMELSLAPDGRKDPFPFESDVDLHSEVELGPEMIKDDEDLNMPQVHPANLYPQQSMTEKRLGDIWLEENEEGIDHVANRSSMMQSEKGSSDYDSDPDTNGGIDPMKMLKLVDTSRMIKKPFKKKMSIKEGMSKQSNGTGNGNNKIFECKLCNIMYRYRRGLDAHAYEEHSGPKTCTQCDETFASNSILRRHTFEVHDNIKTIHQCKYCPLTFKTKTKLQRHRSSHPDDDEITSALANPLGTSSGFGPA